MHTLPLEPPCATDKLAAFLRAIYGRKATEEAARRAGNSSAKHGPEVRKIWAQVRDLLRAKAHA